MKHLLFFIAMLLCNISVQSQTDLDYTFSTKYLKVFSQKIDSAATAVKAKDAKPGAKVENVLSHDTISVREGGVRYLTKQGNNLSIYDPNNHLGNYAVYETQFAGWLKRTPNPILKYNMLKDGKIFGTLTVDLFMQEFYLNTPMRQIFYTNRE